MWRKTMKHEFWVEKWVFDQSECAQGPIYMYIINSLWEVKKGIPVA